MSDGVLIFRRCLNPNPGAITFPKSPNEAPFFSDRISLSAHIETAEWGATTLGMGEIVWWAEATLYQKDIIRTRSGVVTWEGRGDELLVNLVDLLLSLRGWDAEEVELEVSAPAEGEGPLEISIRSDGREDYPTMEIRHLLAHLYEWTAHCQGVPWRSLGFAIRLAGKNVETALSLGY